MRCQIQPGVLSCYPTFHRGSFFFFCLVGQKTRTLCAPLVTKLLVVQLKMVKDNKKRDKRCCGGATTCCLNFVNSMVAAASRAASPCTSSPCVYLHWQSTLVTHPAAQVAATLSLMALHWLIFSHCCQINNHSCSGALASPHGNLKFVDLEELLSLDASAAVSPSTPASESAGFRGNHHVTEPLC